MRLFISFLFIFLTQALADNTDYFQQDVDYKINVTLEPETQTYFGSEKLTYKNNSNTTLNYIWIHLYPNAFKDESTPFARQQAEKTNRSFHFSKESERGFLDLTSVKIADNEVKRQTKEDAIDEVKLFLHEPLKPGQTIIIDFEFKGKFSKTFSRMSYSGKNYFAATQWYPKAVVFDKHGWHPDSYLNMGEFYGEFGNYDVSITLPANFVIDATGMLKDNPEEKIFNKAIIDSSQKLINLKTEKERTKYIKNWKKERKAQTDYSKTKTVQFIAENVHDFAWFAGDLYMIHRSIHNDNVLSNVLVSPDNAYSWRDVTRYLKQTVWFYSENVGKYQYPKASVVDDGQSSGRAMEYPMITFVSIPSQDWHNLLEMAVMHEVGHNWFYGMLGSNERTSMFLDEGLNSFYEYKYMNHFYGLNNMTNFKKLLKGIDILDDIGEWHTNNIFYGLTVNQQIEQPLNLRAEEYTSLNYGAINYQKSVFLLLALEWYLGEDTFEKGVHTYFERWNGKHPQTSDFFAIMSEVSNQNLDWFIDEWINKKTSNDFKISRKSTKQSSTGYETAIYIKNCGTMKNMPAPVHLVTQSGDTLEGRWNGDKEKPVVIKHTSPAKKVEVNLKRIIFETNYLNNSGFLPDFDFNFIAQIPRIDTYPVNIYPYYWYEYFKDKNQIGLGFWSGNRFFNRYSASGYMYYGTASEKIGYKLKLSNRYPGFLSSYLDVGAEIRDIDGLKRISGNLECVCKKRDDLNSSSSITLNFDNVKLYDLIYNDPSVFQETRYSTTTLTFSNKFHRMLYYLHTDFSIERAFKILDSETDFTKISLTSLYKRYLSKKSYLKLHLFAAGIWGSNTPSQEHIFAGDGVDPKHKRFAIGRRGSIAPLRSWTFESGMNMFGYTDINNPYRAGKAGASIGLDLRFSPLPIIYANAAALSQKAEDFGSDGVFAETGIKLYLGPANFIFPVYITDPAPGEKRFAFRFLFRLRMPVRIGM